MSGQENKAKVFNQLVTLVEAMRPFLDCSGQAFCDTSPIREDNPVALPLRSRQVRSLLVYRFREQHKDLPGRDRVKDALDYCEGKLFAQRKGRP